MTAAMEPSLFLGGWCSVSTVPTLEVAGSSLGLLRDPGGESMGTSAH